MFTLEMNHRSVSYFIFWSLSVPIHFFLLFLYLKVLSLTCTLQVPGNLVISARSGVHSFDASKMNMSHVITHLSFGKMISPQVLTDVKRLLPYLGRSHDKLNGRSFINHKDLNANVTVSLFFDTILSVQLIVLPFRSHWVWPRKFFTCQLMMLTYGWVDMHRPWLAIGRSRFQFFLQKSYICL